MIISKNSWKKGGLLFVGVAVIAACIFVALATEILTLQIIAGVAFVATAIGAYKIFKSLETNEPK